MKRLRYGLLVASNVLVWASVSAAGDIKDGWEYYLPIETHLISSKHVRQTYKIEVMQPVRRRGETVRFPVVYVTDGNFQFDVLKGISWSIQRSERDAPRYILVGIGYPGDSPLAGALLRARDLTFPGHPKFAIQTPPIQGVLRAEPGTKETLGAEDFQRFIAEELIPFVDKKYETIVGNRTYFGHSGGGGFGLYTLFTRPDIFQNYIVSSPNLSFDGETSSGLRYENYDFMLQEARKFVASGKSLGSVKLYFSVGAEEEFEPGLEPWQMSSSFYRMVGFLKSSAVPGVELTAETFAGETHMTVWPIAFTHGVQAVFGTRVWKNTKASAAGR